MTRSAAATSCEVYRKRHFEHVGYWNGARPSCLKVYTIAAQGRLLGGDLMAVARRLVESEMADTDKPGFVIVHHGEDAVWLLLHWWMDGGILAERLWSASSATQPQFKSVDRPFMACVWELVPIAFEREAFVATMMNNGSPESYLASILPEGDY